MIEQRPLILRSNRFLGSALMERGLINSDDLEAANEKLLEAIQSGDVRNASLLNILIFDLKVLDEAQLIDSLVEKDEVSLTELGNYDLTRFREMKLDYDLCWATFTIPFDKVENFNMVATGYYLSEPAKQYWIEQLDGEVIWYVSSVTTIAAALDRAEQEQKEASTTEKAEN